MDRSRRIIAVDPGYDRVGIAVLEGNTLIHSECFVPAKGALENRLREVHGRAREIIREYEPRSLALETLFFSKNQKTAIGVAEARGVIMLAAVEAGIPLAEYSPQAVKIAVTGQGNADKRGVIKMVERMVNLPSAGKRYDDEYDAIALGLAHQATQKVSPTQKG
ncbi:MAG: crossover junction endodeoxyribonuclease RuvC [Patescibacteria group bacterium]|nr:crossover junction endodeoxyribonuclease RuvC [Patescibacteria group bacterium]